MPKYAILFDDECTQSKTGETVVFLSPKEADIIGEALMAYKDANKRKKTVANVADWWHENVPVTMP